MKPLKRFSAHTFGWLSRAFVTLLCSSFTVTVYGRETETDDGREKRGQGLLYASWHRSLLFLAYFYRFRNFIIMVSPSDDGELATQAGRRLGWIPVRGSSSRLGFRALREMAPYFHKGHRGGMLVDGPRGPRCVSKIGIIYLAKLTESPIVPVMWSADRCWRVGSWDRTLIPKPFARIVLVYGKEPIHVPRNATKAACERLRQRLDRELNTLRHQADHYFQSGRAVDPRGVRVPRPEPE